jgi:hypothetical protein
VCVLHTYVDRPRKKRLRSTIRLVEDSNCMRMHVKLCCCLWITVGRVVVVCKCWTRNHHISRLPFFVNCDTAVMITTFTCYTKSMHLAGSHMYLLECTEATGKGILCTICLLLYIFLTYLAREFICIFNFLLGKLYEGHVCLKTFCLRYSSLVRSKV